MQGISLHHGSKLTYTLFLYIETRTLYTLRQIVYTQVNRFIYMYIRKQINSHEFALCLASDGYYTCTCCIDICMVGGKINVATCTCTLDCIVQIQRVIW